MLKIRPIFASAFLAFFLLLGLSPSANAGMVGTPQLITDGLSSQALLESRREIEKQLVDLGVEADQASQRVASLSDSQIAEINQKINELPAGADAGGVLLTLFIVFIITDAIGATDIFPFVHPVK